MNRTNIARNRTALRMLLALLVLGLLAAACGDDQPTDAADDGVAGDPAGEDPTDDGATEEEDDGEPADDAPSYRWRLAETHVADYPTSQADIWFADELRRRSNGRIDIEVFTDAQLGQESDVLEQVQIGAIELNRTSASPVAEFVPEWGVFALPYLFDDGDHLWNFLLSSEGDALLERLREGGFVGLAYYDSGARHFYTVNTPVRSPADLAGLSIRVQPGSVPADMVQAMGGDPVVMDFGEVYSALETGVIDGAENNEPSYVSTGHYEVAPYYTLDGHMRVPEVLLIAEEVWDSLSAEDQALVREVARESIDVQRELWNAAVDEAFQAVVDAGNEIIEVDPAPFQEAVQELLAQFEDRYGDIFAAIAAAR